MRMYLITLGCFSFLESEDKFNASWYCWES